MAVLGLLNGFERENCASIAKVSCISLSEDFYKFIQSVANRSEDRTELTKIEHIPR